MKQQNKWLLQNLDVKSRVCTDCEKRKPITEFHFQKPKRVPKIKQHCIDRRRECKDCHYKKSKKLYLKRTTKKERKIYQKEYHKTYVHPALLTYQILQSYVKQ